MPSRQTQPALSMLAATVSSTAPPIIQSPHSQHHHHHHHRLLPPVVAGGGAVLSVLLFLLVLCRKLTRQRTAPADSKPPHRLSYSLLRRATGSFSAHNLLGRGGFGSVYKGIHPSFNHIAVKVMDSGSLQGEREFQNEIFFAQKVNQSANIVTAIGFSCNRRRRRMLLVYELMHNGNLQDALLHRKCVELVDWKKRFSIAIDIAKGIEYLHAFDPPVIHGDIKPSNILLDQNFVAKIGDFGLARLKSDSLGEVTVEIGGGLDGKKKGEAESNGVGAAEDCGSVMEETDSVITGFEEFNVGVDRSPESLTGAESVTVAVTVSPETVEPTLASVETGEVVGGETERVGGALASPSTAPSEGNFDKGSVDSEREMIVAGKQSGRGKRSVSRRDWWWRQDNGEGDSGAVKDYVMDWIGTEIRKERPNSNWIGTASSSAAAPAVKKSEKKRNRKRLEWWASLDEEKNVKKEKRRPAREWWKEEFCEELARKKKKKKRQMGMISNDCGGDNWWPKDEDLYVDRKKKIRSRSRGSRGSVDWWLDGLSGELWRARHNSYDSVSGEIPKSGGVSSTPSMRGTVCYIAPEYGGGGDVSEKCDVYSYGVLLLVLVAGRRPLQVTGSPMSEFQRANLISWARHLARAGRLLDLVDQSIQALDQDQALLCITVALLCLQKSPARRPFMKEVVGMLCGELERPQLPVEFSPSPPSRFPYKSQKKVR
ncbi:receptor-like serine/threonine-protein kinase At4g25390 [Malania oleifera]|uniref:receptor-like serine/threonine-protein kinase At4g25390 n=1 Tax=Malania oleifera TaxID=397392 RepID=UPI0025AE6D10|nr:receptor-like serine/threonine-protein kinase At4g25390 [Malania oleifera]